MVTFIFRAGDHIVEPANLLPANMPKSLAFDAFRGEMRRDSRSTVSGDRVFHKMRVRPDAGGMEATAMRQLAPGETPARNAPGHNNIQGRLGDMRKEGIDPEIVVPRLAVFIYVLEDVDAEPVTCQIYDDWNVKFFAVHNAIFVHCGVLPVRDLANTVSELKRMAERGCTVAMLPTVTPASVPRCNDEVWDTVFALDAGIGIVFVLHAGTGQEDVVVLRGAGGVVVNDTRQRNDTADAIMMLVAAGVLDRHSGARRACVEPGANRLPGAVERMNEICNAHHVMVRPTPGRTPSQIIGDQAGCSFEYDRSGIIARNAVRHRAFSWGSDCPHAEDTVSNGRLVTSRLFDGIDFGGPENAEILGSNAARLFRHHHPAVEMAA